MGVRSIAAKCLAALAFTGVLAACGGSSSSGNGVASKSPEQIVSAATDALEGVRTVHVVGSVTSSSTPMSLNLDLVSGKGAKGQMSANGLGFQIVVVGQTVYLAGDTAFWQHFGGKAAAELFKGKWLKATDSGQFATFAQLSNLHTLLGQILSHHGTLSKGGTTTVNGHKVVAVKDTTQGGTLYVATTGKPYPIEITKGGTSGGRLTFSNFDQPVTLTAPANSIDISQLQGG